MVFGLNLGGKKISVNEDFGSGSLEERAFSPTYVMMDITEPRNPRVMWERTYDGLGLATSIPAPLHIGPRDGTGKWFLVFGSGPTDYDGSSTQSGHIFVVDMETGEPLGSGSDDWIWESARSGSYLNEPLVLDVFQSHNADATYLADTYFDTNDNKLKADVVKITVPCSKCIWEVDSNGSQLYMPEELEYTDDPDNWLISPMFEADGPISVQLSSTVDQLGNLLLYFGTGRYVSESDKSDANQQYLYSVKDPFYNEALYDSTYYHSWATIPPLDTTDLFDTTMVLSTTEGRVNGPGVSGGEMDFRDFATYMRENEDDWYLLLITDSTGATPSERIITQASILGGIVFTPAFTPSIDICDMGGDTTFLGAYFETGTGYIDQLFDIDLANKRHINVTVGSETKNAEVVEIRDDNIYQGMPAPKAPLHGGLESGAKITVQVGTGEFVNINVDPALYFKSIVTEWWDDPNQAPPANPSCNW